MAYGITSESQLIDVATINKGCDVIDDTAENFKECADTLKDGAWYVGEGSLAMDGKTLKPAIEDGSREIVKLQNVVTETTQAIRNLAKEILTEQKAELQEYKRQQALLEEQRRQAAQANGNGA